MTIQPLGAGAEEVTDRHGAFPRLTEDQARMLRDLGEVRRVETGDVLFREGDESHAVSRSDRHKVPVGALSVIRVGHRKNVRLVSSAERPDPGARR